MGALCSRCRRPSAAEDGENKEIELSSFVHIDPALCGKDVRVNNDVVSGTGCAVANCALHQTRSYFEVTIKTSGTSPSSYHQSNLSSLRLATSSHLSVLLLSRYLTCACFVFAAFLFPGTVYIGLTAIPKTALDVPMKDREQTWYATSRTKSAPQLHSLA